MNRRACFPKKPRFHLGRNFVIVPTPSFIYIRPALVHRKEQQKHVPDGASFYFVLFANLAVRSHAIQRTAPFGKLDPDTDTDVWYVALILDYVYAFVLISLLRQAIIINSPAGGFG